MGRVLKKQEVIGLLKSGKEIHWISGIEPKAWINDDTVRIDTLVSLQKEGIITNFGYPALHGKVKLKKGV